MAALDTAQANGSLWLGEGKGFTYYVKSRFLLWEVMT
jgi:hypothetical protein